MNVHQALEYLDNLEVSSDGYSSDESSGDDFISTDKLALVPPKDNDRETDEDSANEDDPNPSCLNKYQLLAETEVNLNTSKGSITWNDTSFSQSSIEKNSSNNQPFSTERKQPLFSISIIYQAIASVCILLICQKRNIDLRPLAFFSKNLHLRCLAGIKELFLQYEILQLTN